MKLLGRLLALFVIVPLVELVLLIRLGQWLGLLPTIAFVVITGVIGAALARNEGLRTLGRIQSDLRSGRFPVGRLLDGGLILFAGGLLLTPGILTDIVGLSLLVPGSRGWDQGPRGGQGPTHGGGRPDQPDHLLRRTAAAGPIPLTGPAASGIRRRGSGVAGWWSVDGGIGEEAIHVLRGHEGAAG
jgi:hypothetical protein